MSHFTRDIIVSTTALMERLALVVLLSLYNNCIYYCPESRVFSGATAGVVFAKWLCYDAVYSLLLCYVEFLGQLLVWLSYGKTL